MIWRGHQVLHFCPVLHVMVKMWLRQFAGKLALVQSLGRCPFSPLSLVLPAVTRPWTISCSAAFGARHGPKIVMWFSSKLSVAYPQPSPHGVVAYHSCSAVWGSPFCVGACWRSWGVKQVSSQDNWLGWLDSQLFLLGHGEPWVGQCLSRLPSLSDWLWSSPPGNRCKGS